MLFIFRSQVSVLSDKDNSSIEDIGETHKTKVEGYVV